MIINVVLAIEIEDEELTAEEAVIGVERAVQRSFRHGLFDLIPDTTPAYTVEIGAVETQMKEN